MNPSNEKLAIQMLEEIDRARSGTLSLDELETRLWRLLESTDQSFPLIVASQVEDLVRDLRERQNENGPADAARGLDQIFNAAAGALGELIR